MSYSIYQTNPELSNNIILDTTNIFHIEQVVVDRPKYTAFHKQILDHYEVLKIKNYFNSFSKDKFYNVGLNGLPNNKEIGSKRITIYNPELAKYLNQKLLFKIPYRKVDKFTSVDHGSKFTGVFKPIGISPLFRYMIYNPKSSGHNPHYDSPYVLLNDENNNVRTLFSGVIYLTTHTNTGATVLINDGQDNLEFSNRNTSDWDNSDYQELENNRYLPNAGNVLLFDHQICHAVEPNNSNTQRIIIRFDVFFEELK